MSPLSFAAATGLLSLVGGVFLVNVVSTPRGAQVGTIIAGLGVLLLAAVAVRHLLS
jgi:hypothetical protein